MGVLYAYTRPIGIASCMAALSEGMHQLTFTVLDSHGNQGQTMQLLSVLSSSDVDNDGDGYSEEEGDCNDENPNISPGTTESLNGLDDDCDGLVDNGTDGFDDDGDGYSEVEGTVMMQMRLSTQVLKRFVTVSIGIVTVCWITIRSASMMMGMDTMSKMETVMMAMPPSVQWHKRS